MAWYNKVMKSERDLSHVEVSSYDPRSAEQLETIQKIAYHDAEEALKDMMAFKGGRAKPIVAFSKNGSEPAAPMLGEKTVREHFKATLEFGALKPGDEKAYGEYFEERFELGYDPEVN